MRLRACLLTSLLLAGPARAVDMCVGDEASLKTALAAVNALPSADHIRLKAGDIELTEPLIGNASSSAGGDLEISGGWNSDCTVQTYGSPWTRLFEATGADTMIYWPSASDLRVHDLTFDGIGGGVSLTNAHSTDTAEQTALRVSRVAVFNSRQTGDALQLFSSADLISIDNVLVDTAAGCGIVVATYQAGGEVHVRSTTSLVRMDPAAGGPAGAAICFDGVSDAAINTAVNSLFQSEGPADVVVNGLPVLFESSAWRTIDFCSGCGFVDPVHPQSHDNLATAIIVPYSLGSTAAAKRQGLYLATMDNPALVDTGQGQHLGLYPLDVDGDARLVGIAQDRGAFEILPVDYGIFDDGFE